MSKSHHISPTLNKITDLRVVNDLTVFTIAHMNKWGNDLGLVLDRVSGGASLKAWLEHAMLITKTNEPHLRLLRFDKSRDDAYANCYYEIGWEYPMLENLGVSTDWSQLMVGEVKMEKWVSVLDRLNNDEFTKMDMENVVVNILNMSKSTAKNYLKGMKTAGVIIKVKHGVYKKGLKIRGKR